LTTTGTLSSVRRNQKKNLQPYLINKKETQVFFDKNKFNEIFKENSKPIEPKSKIPVKLYCSGSNNFNACRSCNHFHNADAMESVLKELKNVLHHNLLEIKSDECIRFFGMYYFKK
jgi:hypothetical protein